MKTSFLLFFVEIEKTRYVCAHGFNLKHNTNTIQFTHTHTFYIFSSAFLQQYVVVFLLILNINRLIFVFYFKF